MKRSQDQNRKIHYFLNELNIYGEDKKELIHSATSGRSESSKDLTREEAEHLLEGLKTIDKKRKKKQRGAIIHFLCIADPEKFTKSGSPNYKAINNWIQKYGKIKKPLLLLNYKELNAIVSQVQKLNKRELAR